MQGICRCPKAVFGGGGEARQAGGGGSAGSSGRWPAAGIHPPPARAGARSRTVRTREPASSGRTGGGQRGGGRMHGPRRRGRAAAARTNSAPAPPPPRIRSPPRHLPRLAPFHSRSRRRLRRPASRDPTRHPAPPHPHCAPVRRGCGRQGRDRPAPARASDMRNAAGRPNAAGVPQGKGQRQDGACIGFRSQREARIGGGGYERWYAGGP